MPCSLLWKESATPAGRPWWALSMSARRTGDTGFGLWRTATAQEAGARLETLQTKVGDPATTGQRAYRRQPNGELVLQSVTLGQQVKMWPTAQASDAVRADMPAAALIESVDHQREHRPRGAPSILGAEVHRHSEWFTPQAWDWKDTGPTQGNRKDVNLGVQVFQQWPTPTLQPERENQGGANGKVGPVRSLLISAEKDWQTPKATNVSTPVMHHPERSDGGQPNLPHQVFAGLPAPASSSKTGKPRGSLNARWVLQLMGYPADWLDGTKPDSKPLETPSSRKS
jgi:hypothetical protein